MAIKRPILDQYRAILDRKGIALDKCTILAFMFPDSGKCAAFHYRVMDEITMEHYLLFDSRSELAQIVLEKDDKLTEKVKELAEQSGGKKTTPRY